MVPKAPDGYHDEHREEVSAPETQLHLEQIGGYHTYHERDDGLDVDGTTAPEFALEAVHAPSLTARESRQWDVDLDTSATLAVQVDPAIELIGHQPVHDLEAEAGVLPRELAG